MSTIETGLTYEKAGVKYSLLDQFKEFAGQQARTTTQFADLEYRISEESRGQPAQIWELDDRYIALVQEGIGTKHLVANQVRAYTGKSHYREIGIDTAASIFNDISAVGAHPRFLLLLMSIGDSQWFADEGRKEDFSEGIKEACKIVDAEWVGGETQELSGIVKAGEIVLAGSCLGDIKVKERKTTGEKLTAGDRIVLIESSGIHTNGLTLARKVAHSLPEYYQTKLPSGKTYGEALLTPSHLYSPLIESLFEAGVDIHYIAPLTGQPYSKKLPRGGDFAYVIEQVPKPQEEFLRMQQVGGISDKEMYNTCNMGAGLAILAPQRDVDKIQQIALEIHNLQSLDAGYIEEGEKQVIIRPKDIVF